MNHLALAYLSLFARTILGGTPIVAGAAKLGGSTERLKVAVQAYGISSSNLAGFISTLLPYLEAGIGVLLICGLLMPLPALAATLLFVTFAAVMGINLVKGRTISCGCWGIRDDEKISWWRVGVDCCLAVVGLMAAGWPSLEWTWPLALKPKSITIQSLASLGTVLSAVGVFVAILLGKAFILLFRPAVEARPSIGGET